VAVARRPANGRCCAAPEPGTTGPQAVACVSWQYYGVSVWSACPAVAQEYVGATYLDFDMCESATRAAGQCCPRWAPAGCLPE
jgi:hypothetical protein